MTVEVGLDGTGKTTIDTPLPFLSHMLDQIGRHGLFDLAVKATGDIEIDGHHTTEDVGIVLGKAFAAALGDKAGIARYGSATLPMDEARATAAVDLTGSLESSRYVRYLTDFHQSVTQRHSAHPEVKKFTGLLASTYPNLNLRVG